MSEEQNNDENGEVYDLMLTLERLESLREDLEELSFKSLAEVEAALALTTEANGGEKRVTLQEIRAELLDLGLKDRTEVENQIDRLNEQLDTLEE